MKRQLFDCFQTMYEDKGVSYLLDFNDTVHAYEERGRLKTGPESQDAQEIHALSQMNHIQQVEVIQGMSLHTHVF